MEQRLNGSGVRIGRRDILKLMTTLPAAALVSVTPLTSSAAMAMPQEPVNQNDPAGYKPKVFNPHEWLTIQVLSDLIIPADEQSCSASEAGVPEFIDDWLHVKQGILLDRIRGGITWLDMASNRSFQFDFIDCSIKRQKQILDRIAYPIKAAPEDVSAVIFFNGLRDLVVSGFFTSRQGIRDLPYVGNQPQQKWNGCPPQVRARLGLDVNQA